jgi:hypothetical protein
MLTCRHAECRYTECHYTDCCGAQTSLGDLKGIKKIQNLTKNDKKTKYWISLKWKFSTSKCCAAFAFDLYYKQGWERSQFCDTDKVCVCERREQTKKRVRKRESKRDKSVKVIKSK